VAYGCTKWRDALRSRPLELGARPRRSVALHITRKHASKRRGCSAIRDCISRSLRFAKIDNAYALYLSECGLPGDVREFTEAGRVGE